MPAIMQVIAKWHQSKKVDQGMIAFTPSFKFKIAAPLECQLLQYEYERFVGISAFEANVTYRVKRAPVVK